MDDFLLGYTVNRPTWFYLSLLLILAVYFRFNRLWSLRNLDLALLLCGSPGLLFVGAASEKTQALGHVWLFTVTGLFLLRLFLDPFLQRRPYLGQNLNAYGLGFLCLSAFAFLMTEAITESLPASAEETVSRANNLLDGTGPVALDTETAGPSTEDTAKPTPAATSAGQKRVPRVAGASPSNGAATGGESGRQSLGPSPDSPESASGGIALPLITAPVALVFEDLAARILAILAHAAVICGLWLVGRNLFGDANLGLAMATLYLLLPCTAYNVGEFNHVLPSALIVWAVVFYRKPIVSGVLLGLACGAMLFPVVLLPLWAAFYGRKGAGRFAIALFGVALILGGTLLFVAGDQESFVRQILTPVDLAFLDVTNQNTAVGFWRNVGYLSFYRLPVLVAYFLMLLGMTIWPRKRSVETLLSQSAAAIVGTQLWYTDLGGVYLLWYLPLLLMVIFRPRLVHLLWNDAGQAAAADSRIASSRASTTRAGAASSQRLQLFR